MSINVLKMGGGAGIDYHAILGNLATRIGNDERWIVVHGASDVTNQLCEEMGFTPQTITSPNGHVSRYTDAQTIDIYTIAAGTVNQEIRSILSDLGISAINLVGENTIQAQRKKAIRAILNGRQIVIRDDYSGKIAGTDRNILMNLLDNGCVPVVAPLATGEEGENLNVDGDLVAATIAHELNADRLLILSNVPGLLRDVEDAASLIAEIPLHEIEHYQQFAQGRMKKKLIAAQQAAIQHVILAGSNADNPVDAALNRGGTHIYREIIHA